MGCYELISGSYILRAVEHFLVDEVAVNSIGVVLFSPPVNAYAIALLKVRILTCGFLHVQPSEPISRLTDRHHCRQ